MKHTKHKLLSSIATLFVCLAMFIGSTYAWFTDSASTGVNKIQAGNLDIELYHESKNVQLEKVTTSTENLFKDVEFWEPGAYSYETFTVKNEGNLALKYKMGINVIGFTSYNNHNLLEVLKVKVVDEAPTSRPSYGDGVTLKDWTYGDGAVNTNLYPVTEQNDSTKPSEKKFTVVVYWEPSENDNVFNMNNGRPNPLSIDLGVEVVATQLDSEFDSFDNKYDKDTENSLTPVTPVENAMASAKVSSDGSATLTAKVAPTTVGTEETSVVFESGALSGTDAKLSVNTTNTLFDIKASEDVQVASVDLSLSVDGSEVTSFNDKTATVTTYISTGLSDVKVTYKDLNGNIENITVVSYDPSTGKLVFTTNHFSVYGVSGRAVAYNLNKDKGYAPIASNGSEPTENDIKNAYLNAAADALTDKVALTPGADYKKAEEAALENNAGFEMPKDSVTDDNKWVATIDTRHFVSLESAITAAEAGNTIKIEKNITISKQLNIVKELVLDGANHNITSANFVTTGNSDKYMILCTSGATVKNLTLNGDNQNFGLQFYTAKNGKVENVVLNDFKLGLCVNASTVTAEGTFSQSNIGWGKVINVGYGSDIPSGTECKFDFTNASFEGVESIYSDEDDINRASNNGITITYVLSSSWVETSVNGKKCATPAAAKIGEKYYSTLKDALNSAVAGQTVEMLKDFVNADLANSIHFSLKNGVILDGKGYAIRGNADLYMASAADAVSTVKNVVFQYIHNGSMASQADCDWYGWENGKKGTMSAIHVDSLQGTVNIVDCTFDNVDWDAIQITPKSGSVVNIIGNTFSHSSNTDYSQLRYIHIQASGYTPSSITINNNKFYKTRDMDADSITNIGIWYVSSSGLNLNGNYFEYEQAEKIIDTNSEIDYSTIEILFPARSAADVDIDDLNPVSIIGDIAYLDTSVTPAAYNGNITYNTLQDAINNTSEAYLAKDNFEDVSIPADKTFRLNTKTFKQNGTITNNGNLTTAFGTNAEGMGTIINNGTLTLGCNAAAGYTVENNGTVKITYGVGYNFNKISNSENGKIVISGGTFVTAPNPDWIELSYKLRTNEDGTYGLELKTDEEAVEAGAVARYFTSNSSYRKYYKTVQEGVQNGIVHLITDVNENVTKTSGSIDLFCDDYTFSGSLSCPGKTLYIDNGTAILDNIECGTFYGGYSAYNATITVKAGSATTIKVAKNAKVTIEGGTYTGSITVTSGGTGSLTIKGGTFSSDPTAYLAVGYSATKNSDGIWTVSK